MKKTSIGGSALIEGLMMIGPENAAIAVRKPDGEIISEKRALPIKDVFSKIWVLRGSVNFFRQMILVYKAMMFSASFIDIEEEDEKEKEKQNSGEKREKAGKGETLSEAVIYIAVLLSICFSIGLFMLLPNFITGLFSKYVLFIEKGGAGFKQVGLHLFEGAVRIFIFVLYLYFASKMKDIYRVWQYHGAEHKTIHCYENQEELTVENVRKYTTRHPRCGTSFMLIVMVMSIIVFSFTGWWSLWINIIIRIAALPLIAGLSYELLKWSGRSENKFVRLLNVPGEWFQAFTTKEPDDAMIEVAITAMKNVITEDEKADEW